MRISILFLGLLLSITCFSQENEEFKKYKKLYPNEDYVKLQQNINYNIEIEDKNLKITKSTHEQELFLDETATHNRKQSLWYSTFTELKDIEAATLNPKNSRNAYKSTSVEEFNEKNDLDDTFYNDSKSLNFLYPDLKKGSKTDLRYTYNIKNPRFLSPFYFGNFYPFVDVNVTIEADENVKLDFKYFNTDTLDIDFEKKQKGRSIIYSWRAKNINAFEYEENAPNFKSILPHVIPIIRSYTTDEGEKKLLNGVEDLYNWYYSLVKDINQTPADEDLVALVQDLTKGKTSNLEKVKALYYWTQQNIKYIAFEYALGGFIPREANDVFRKKYGDCKDNSSILQKMLEIAGLEGHLTWIGTRSIPYTYEDVPTPAVDNHMILSYRENDKIYYLDATGRYIKIDYPSSFIQGKEALVASGADAFKIEKVPVVPAKMNQIIDSTTVYIDGNGLKGASKTYFSGYPLFNLYYDLERFDKPSDVSSYYKSRLFKGNNSFLISNFEEFNKFSYEKDFYVVYDYTVDNYVQNIGSEIFINPHLNRFFSGFKTEEDRKYSKEYDYKRQYNYTNTFHIPDGYVVEYIPENVSYSNAYVDFEMTYSQKDNTIITQQKAAIKTLELDIEQQKAANSVFENAEKAYKEIIILKKQ